jgi:hypothetical protein
LNFSIWVFSVSSICMIAAGSSIIASCLFRMRGRRTLSSMVAWAM